MIYGSKESSKLALQKSPKKVEALGRASGGAPGKARGARCVSSDRG